MSTREQYIEKLAAKLKEWDNEIDMLRSRAEQAKADAKVRYREQLVELREQRDKAAVLLDEMHESSGTAWKSVKEKVDRLYADVKGIFRKAA
ncbi:MAG TPA: hypothetical protein VGB23_05265 [Nitrospirota bacterium]